MNDGLGLVERDLAFPLILSLKVLKRDRLGEEGDVMVDGGEENRKSQRTSAVREHFK